MPTDAQIKQEYDAYLRGDESIPPTTMTDRVEQRIRNAAKARRPVEVEVQTSDAPSDEQMQKEYEAYLSGEDVEQEVIATDDPNSLIDNKGTIGDAIGEPILSIGSNLAGMAASGITQMATAPFIGLDEAQRKGQAIEQTVSEFGAPRTQMGASSMQDIGGAMQFLGDEFNQTAGGIADLTFGGGDAIREQGLFPMLGQETMDRTGLPMLATGVEMIPEALGGLLSARQIAKHAGAQTLPKQELATRIKSGDMSGDLAKYTLDSKGKLITDMTAQDAINIGIDPGFLQHMKALDSPKGIGMLKGKPKMNPTKEKLLEMLRIKKKGASDQMYADQNRATDIIGDSALDRLNYIKKVNRKAGSAIDVEAEKLKGATVDFTQPVSNFEAGLKKMGVTFDAKSGKVDFAGSDIEGLGGLESTVNRVISRMAKGGDPSAYDVHRLKRYLDKNIGYGKQIEGLDSDVEHLLRQLRVDLDGALDNKFPAYDKANTAYAETIDLIKEMKSLAGAKVDLTGAAANRSMGQTMRKALTNYQSGARVKQIIADMDGVSIKHGANFGDDINMLISFDNQLDTIFGASASGGFQAGISAGVRNAINGALDNRSIKSKAADYAIKAITPKQKDAFDVIERSITGDASPWMQ